MFYGNLSSTWPVHTGVLVEDGTAYFAAGIIDQDGTYVYALDARTGNIKWQNNSSGHISDELRKGISAQGNLSIKDGQLLLAGGNQVSPGRFDLETGECPTKTLAHGRPKANNGQFVGVFRDLAIINGGRILHAAPENVSTKGHFAALTDKNRLRMNNGGIPPTWDERRLTLVNFRNGKLTCLDADKVAERMRAGFRADNRPRGDRPGGQNWLYGLATALQRDGAALWQTDLGQPNKFEVVSLASCPNGIVTVVAHQVRNRAQQQWFAVALGAEDGKQLWKQELKGKPLPGGLLVDRNGQVIVTMLAGDVVCIGSATAEDY
jgi:outer membrane protein assembly factor BamB